ncbi:hypothetical protein TNCV_2397351 [Trichonephila clavipes]|uniref:Uncharacterized protein n=1 Tax=Trichonephila clavipes TaxID=2585209 RepID=A0A8X6SVL7_TRICX|nr:hypothetical protein TNCV_2397351 [Trichonephila clavipes]
MSEERLSYLSLISIEQQEARKIELHELITDFAKKNDRLNTVDKLPLRAAGGLVVRTLDSRPKGFGSIPVPPNTLRVHTDSTLKLRRWRKVVSPSIGPSGNFAELNPTVTSMVLKANDRRLAPCHDEYRGPQSDYVRQVA